MSQDTTLPPLPDSVAVAIGAYGDERADDSPTALNHYRAAIAAVREWGAAIAAQAPRISADNVQWIVNDNAELGVMISGQAFFLYKGESLVYGAGKHDDGRPMQYRPVFKREFGECAHPINYKQPHLIGAVSLDDSTEWRPLPEHTTTTAQAPQPEHDVRKIMLDVVPGWDGEGAEVYAKSVRDVEDLLSKMSDRIEELEGRAQQAQGAPAGMYERIAEAHDACLDEDHRGCRVILCECMSLLAAAPQAPAPAQEATERAAFEAWLVANRYSIDRHAGGYYNEKYVRHFWMAWQARAALAAPQAVAAGWLPIETAPRQQGIPIIVSWPVREPLHKQLTDDQIKARKPICADFVSFRAGIRSIELDFGIYK